jgi:hypothetical protein
MRHQGRPGGIVLHQDEQGFRHLWEADSNEELEERWSTVSNEYSRFNDEREARERAEDERAARTQGELGSTAIADDLSEAEQLERERGEYWAKGETLAERGIREGLRSAERENRALDDATARLVSEKLIAELARSGSAGDSPGQAASIDAPLAVSTPALNALVASGVILEDDIYQELYADMDGQSPEIRKLVDALQGYCIRRADKGPVARWGRDDAERDTPSGVKPEIWVGSLSDYNAGVLHGIWIDAWQEPEEIQEQVSWMLRTSPTGNAEEYAIFDHSDFCGLQVDENMSLADVSRLARGIAEHGEAFAKWAGYLGLQDLDAVQRTFEEACQGRHESMSC